MIEKDILYDDSGKEVQSDQFKEIMHGTMSKDDAEKFWQRQFGGERNVRFLTEDELRQRTRDCSEEQFCFDGALSSEIKDILSQFDETDWNKMELSEEVLIEKFAEQIGKELGMEEIPEIDFYDGPEGEYGCYIERYNAIGINRNTLDNVKELIDTIAHEMRHGYQKYRADIGETEMDQMYRYGLEHYIAPEYDEDGYIVNFMDYYDQLMEAEARAFAKQFRCPEVI